MQVRGRAPEPVREGAGARSMAGTVSCGGVAKVGLTMHPPYLDGSGLAFMWYSLDLPERPVVFTAAVGKGDGSDLGDGIYYRVEVETADGARKTVAEQHVGRHEWKPISADLSSWRGQRVKLYLVADCGPKNNTAGDWSAWGDLKLKFK